MTAAAVAIDNGMSNARYLAYCIANGAVSTSEMLARDRSTWPGGHMCGFTSWIGEQWAEWERETRFPRGSSKGEPQQREFDAWLAERVITAKR